MLLLFVGPWMKDTYGLTLSVSIKVMKVIRGIKLARWTGYTALQLPH
jgi:hypothetical protein